MGCLYQLPGGREVCSLGCSIEDVRFADRVSFQLSSLSVEALDRDSSTCDASEHYHCEFKIRSHGSPSDCGVSIQMMVPPHIRAHVALVVSHNGKAKVQGSGALMRQKAGGVAAPSLKPRSGCQPPRGPSCLG